MNGESILLAKPKMTEWPDITIIIITKGRNELATKAVDSILKTHYPAQKRKILVLDETDTPCPITGLGVQYQAIPQKDFGFGYARSKALSYATGDILLFTDDDCTVATDWIEQSVKPLLKNPEIAAAGGAVHIPPNGVIGQCENILGFPGGGSLYVYLSKGKLMDWPVFSTCNCIIRRSAINEAGGFNQAIREGGEDELLARKISKRHRVVFNPNSKVFHRPRNNIIKIFKWFMRRGHARISTFPYLENKKNFVYYQIYTSQTLRIIFLLMIIVFFRLPLFQTFTIVFFLYYVSIMFRYYWSRKYFPDIKTLCVLPIVKLTMDFGMDFGIIKAFLLKKRTKCE